MAKRLFLFLLISLIGVGVSPEFLSAEGARIVNSPVFKDVPTVIIEKPVEQPVTQSTTQSAQVVKANTILPTVQPAKPYVAPAPQNVINIAGKSLKVTNVSDTLVDSGSGVNRYGEKFLYGHNTPQVFGGLASVAVGSTFTVTLNGVTKTYKVMKKVTYEKNQATGKLQLNGSGSYMNSVAKAKSDGVIYSLSIMTCAGTALGGGDATHRLVVFANEI